MGLVFRDLVILRCDIPLSDHTPEEVMETCQSMFINRTTPPSRSLKRYWTAQVYSHFTL
jgi:hypothetical protein